ncbi:ligand-binding sensor domain-containing protein [Saccharicrinis carchari]|nr:two-component regulator propeller domain-containing protein [Saccharicrinis carchari]
MRYNILVGLCFYLFSAYGAVPSDVSVTSYSVNEGLTGNGITAIFQDSRGFLWIGTQDGLNMYNGYTFRSFRHTLSDSTSISGNQIQCIAEDSNGDIWIGTIGNGLSKWSRNTETFTSFGTNRNSLLNMPEDNIYGLYVDSDATLWAKTDNYLLNISTKPLALSTYGLYSNIFKFQDKLSIPIFRKSPYYLWIGTKEGVAQFNIQNKLHERLVVDHRYGTYSNEVGAITGMLQLTNKSYLWGGKQGLFHITQVDSGKFITKEINHKLSNKMGGVNAILQHSSGTIWVATKSGLLMAEYDEKQDVVYFDSELYYNRPQNMICSEEVTFLFEDSSGLLWVGTRYNGLFKADFKPKKFGSIRPGIPKYEDLNSADIKSIFIDERNMIWLGTSDKGIKIIDQVNGDIYHYPVNLTLNKIDQDMVLSMCKDSQQRVWIGTPEGIYVFYLDKGLITEFSYANSKEVKYLLKQNRINTIAEDAKGNIWFGTQFGLYRYDGSVITNYFADTDNQQGICSDEVNDLYLDSEGILWIGTSNGVNFIDSNSDSVKRIGRLRNSHDSISVLSNNYILSITEDLDHSIWFGTRSGLSFYNKKNDTSGFYTHSSGLANDMVYGVLCDLNSDIWLSTNKGISVIKTNMQIHNFDKTDGLPGYVFNPGVVARSQSGVCYFGGAKGVAYLNPDSIHYNMHRPKMVFTSIELYHRGKLVKKCKRNREHIKLKYRKSSMLKVRFAALEFSEPSKNKYQTYLEGFDDDWRPVTTNNVMDISDLPAGEYTLHVKGANNDLVWTDEPLSISIEIVPPIWMTNYAYAFYFIALLFLVQSIINYQIRHYKKAYKAMGEKAVDKKKIEAQREQLSKINQSLTDSIYYARRIQEAILPSESEIQKVLPQSFVYYRPKDLVSGDFYWKHQVNDKIFVAAVDCTGHGVPGAFMSIVAYDMLKSILNSEIKYCPAYILDRLNKEINDTFKKKQGNITERLLNVDDGMDIALCIIDKKNKKLSFAGANNPLYLVRQNEIFIYKGDRFPIGYKGDKDILFSRHDIQLEENDVFYIFSDGYADQFGGSDGKKFKYRRFRHLLLNIHQLPAEDQKAILHQKIEEWMGSHEQVDDIIVMGVQPLKP